ncbi:MAG: SPOR domain-containing protein, partial [Bacteroidetes bacterium]|nr:SPOR domain-containing protein [Bacteroidota bacterium]
MNIDSYISQLLYRYQCVTVPGLGAFLTETQSAQWIESTNSFFPPKKMISFNTNLKNNDGLLANHIASSEKISYNYAVNAIEYQVVKWKR